MKYDIPLFELNFDEAEEKAVTETLRSKWLSTGPKTSEFEQNFSSALGAKHAVALSNCTVALHLALKIAGIKEGDEVICPSLTFVATANAIRYLHAKPVFCDIVDYTNLTIDPDHIKNSISRNTKAIMVMHYGGFACEMNEIVKIAERENLKIVEDACHGPLSEYNGKKLGTIGDVGCFSFFSNKNMTTAEGGMLVTNSKDTFNKAKLLRSHGMTSLSFDRAKGHSTSYDVVDLGFNYRLTDLQAALGNSQMQRLDDYVSKRHVIAERYNTLLTDLPVERPWQDPDNYSSYHLYVIRLKLEEINKTQREVFEKLRESGIGVNLHYIPIYRQPYYEHLDIDKSAYPEAEQYYSEVISLPIYPSLSHQQQDEVVSYLKAAIQQ